MTMSDNTLGAVVLLLLAIIFILTIGEPDLIDAIIYHLTDGSMVPNDANK